MMVRNDISCSRCFRWGIFYNFTCFETVLAPRPAIIYAKPQNKRSIPINNPIMYKLDAGQLIKMRIPKNAEISPLKKFHPQLGARTEKEWSNRSVPNKR